MLQTMTNLGSQLALAIASDARQCVWLSSEGWARNEAWARNETWMPGIEAWYPDEASAGSEYAHQVRRLPQATASWRRPRASCPSGVRSEGFAAWRASIASSHLLSSMRLVSV